MNPYIRILAVVAGVAVGLVFVMGGDMASGMMAPSLKTIDPANKQSVIDAMSQVPLSAFLIMLGVHAVGAFAGGSVATVISGRTVSRPAIIVGIMLTIGSILNQMEIPHPIWYAIVSTLIYIPCAWGGYNVLKIKASEE